MSFLGAIGCCCCCKKTSKPYIKSYSIFTIVLSAIKILFFLILSCQLSRTNGLTAIPVVLLVFNIVVLIIGSILLKKHKKPNFQCVKRSSMVMIVIHSFEVFLILMGIIGTAVLLFNFIGKEMHHRNTEVMYDRVLQNYEMHKPWGEHKNYIPDYDGNKGLNETEYIYKPKPDEGKDELYYRPVVDHDKYHDDRDCDDRRYHHGQDKHHYHTNRKSCCYLFFLLSSFVFFGFLIWQIHAAIILLKCANFELKKTNSRNGNTSTVTEHEERIREINYQSEVLESEIGRNAKNPNVYIDFQDIEEKPTMKVKEEVNKMPVSPDFLDYESD